MAELPSQFAKRYQPVTVHCLSGTHYVPVERYLSGEPRKKKYNAAALNDLSRFLHKKGRYKNGAHGADRHSWDSGSGLAAFGLVGTSYFLDWLWVEITWLQLQLGFYGKGTPSVMRKILQVIDYYLEYADMDLDQVYWSRKMDLKEYAYWYLGLDCNGFVGAYLETYFPALGITGNSHINYWDNKLKKRKDLAEVRSGDILSREGGGGTRHVAMINAVFGVPGPTGDKLSVEVTHSSGSNNGLGTQKYTLKQLKTSSSNKLGWELMGYYKFEHCFAPEAK